MARDGTYRGGRRVKAGSKPEALVDKIAAGKEANVLETHDFDPEALFAPDEPEARHHARPGGNRPPAADADCATAGIPLCFRK